MDEIPPGIPPRPRIQSNLNNAGIYSSPGAGYSTFSPYGNVGINNALGRRVGYGSTYDPYSRYIELVYL